MTPMTAAEACAILEEYAKISEDVAAETPLDGPRLIAVETALRMLPDQEALSVRANLRDARMIRFLIETITKREIRREAAEATTRPELLRLSFADRQALKEPGDK